MSIESKRGEGAAIGILAAPRRLSGAEYGKMYN